MTISLASIQTTAGLIGQDLFRPRPPGWPEDFEKHLHAAADWLITAQRASGEGGLAASYSPLRKAWTPSYPETTGYTIPTLLRYAKRFDRPAARQAALEMAEYELRVQDPAGGFPAMRVRANEPYRLVAFDTGQVAFGLMAAYGETRRGDFAEALERACNWLVEQQNSEGWWDDYYGERAARAIDTRVAWALILAARLSGEKRYQAAAIRQLEWTLGQQNEAGWFASSAFKAGAAPILHTLAYTGEGLLECGLLLGEERYVLAARRMAAALADRQRGDGFLPGAFRADWGGAASWACITGQAQMALIWLRLAEAGAADGFMEAAGRGLGYAARSQALEHGDPGVRGGLPGSWPIYGSYLRLKYPNWAAKFFVDAAMIWLKNV
jgi:hypothetical protein